ncbi:hypothetical protein D2E25_0723 [Bifidobacterium goeldii]|uniref:Uncharacterized protein n=1 Tax=Bifidobacterium goeldii TaxID=2306975 RepID=A0A430FNL0_9BIFI|nr:hypothetical protein D2E25_0723 [Bifidobacterium goeldii]
MVTLAILRVACVSNCRERRVLQKLWQESPVCDDDAWLDLYFALIAYFVMIVLGNVVLGNVVFGNVVLGAGFLQLTLRVRLTFVTRSVTGSAMYCRDRDQWILLDWISLLSIVIVRALVPCHHPRLCMRFVYTLYIRRLSTVHTIPCDAVARPSSARIIAESSRNPHRTVANHCQTVVSCRHIDLALSPISVSFKSN